MTPDNDLLTKNCKTKVLSFIVITRLINCGLCDVTKKEYNCSTTVSVDVRTFRTVNQSRSKWKGM